MSKASGKTHGRADCVADRRSSHAPPKRRRAKGPASDSDLRHDDQSSEQWPPPPCEYCPPPDKCEFCKELVRVCADYDDDECFRGWLCFPCCMWIYDIELNAAKIRKALAYTDRPRLRAAV